MATQTFTVTAQDTARAVGSGDLDVLGTPVLLGWMEQVTLEGLSASLASGQTSVGTRVELEHLAAARLGTEVQVRADIEHADGRLFRFTVAAQDERGRLLGTATLTRVVVDRERFLGRIS